VVGTHGELPLALVLLDPLPEDEVPLPEDEVPLPEDEVLLPEDEVPLLNAIRTTTKK